MLSVPNLHPPFFRNPLPVLASFVILLSVNVLFGEPSPSALPVPEMYQVTSAANVADPMTTISFGPYPRILLTQSDIAPIRQKIKDFGWAKNHFAGIETKAEQAMADPDLANPVIPNICKLADSAANNACNNDRNTLITKLNDALLNLSMAYYFTDKSEQTKTLYAQRAKIIVNSFLNYYRSQPAQPADKICNPKAGYLFTDIFAESNSIRNFLQAYDLTLGITTGSSQLIDNTTRSNIKTYMLDRLVQKFQCYTTVFGTTQNKMAGVISTKGLIAIETGNLNLLKEAFSSTTRKSFIGHLSTDFSSDGYWHEGPGYQYGVVLNAYIKFVEAVWHCGGKTVYEYKSPVTNLNFIKALNAIPVYLMTPSGYIPAFEDSSMFMKPYNYYEQYYSHLVAENRATAVDHQFYPWIIRKVDPNRAGLYSLTDGVGNLPDNGPLSQKSNVYPNSGFAVLRAGPIDNSSMATLEFHRDNVTKSSHLHPHDTFSMSYFANNTYLVPELGKVNDYSNPIHPEYFKQSIAHNNFTVDKKSIGYEDSRQSSYAGRHDKICTGDWSYKSNVQIPAKTLTGDFQFVSVTGICSGNNYPNTPWFEASVKRTILLTPDYLVDVLSIKPTDNSHIIDVPLHVNMKNGVLNLPNQQAATLGSASGYQYLTNARGGAVNGTFDATWEENGLTFKLTDLGSPAGSTAYLVNAPIPVDSTLRTENWPMLVRRSTVARNTTREFVSLLESYQSGNRLINNINKSGNIITVNYQNGTVHTINIGTFTGTVTPPPSSEPPAKISLTLYKCNGYPNSINYPNTPGPNPFFYIAIPEDKTPAQLFGSTWTSGSPTDRCTSQGAIGKVYRDRYIGTTPLYALMCHVGSGSRFTGFNTVNTSEFPNPPTPYGVPPSAYSYCLGYDNPSVAGTDDLGKGLAVGNNGQPIGHIYTSPPNGVPTIPLYRKITGSFFGGKFHLSANNNTNPQTADNNYRYSLDTFLSPAGLIGYMMP